MSRQDKASEQYYNRASHPNMVTHYKIVDATIISKATGKTCYVLLECLDQKTLDQYLRKEDSRVSSKSVMKENKKQAKRQSRSVKGRSETSLKDYFKRRRKVGTKPLNYTDDEVECIGTNSKEKISEKIKADKLSPPVNELPKSEIMASDKGTPIEAFQENPELNRWKNSNGTERNGLILDSTLKSSLNKTAKKQPKSDVRPSEPSLQEDIEDFPKITDSVANDYNLGRVKSEVDLVKELGKCGSFETEVNRDEKGEDCKWEAEERNEDEDDKATVVFEKSLCDSVADIDESLEPTEEKIRSAKKKFREKKLMIRKKRTLVKFKRKRSMIGRNLAKMKKLKNKCTEMIGSSPQIADKESVSERYVREVCALVKHLHELYRIIWQLKNDLPMDAKQADYLIETVNAQQSNFSKEIKKSQKIIMRGYDRMLNSFGSAGIVSVEIGKRTSLSKEDIENVISKCTLQSRPESKKRPAGTQESSQELPSGVGSDSKKIKESNEKGDSHQEPDTPQSVCVEISTKEGLPLGSKNVEGTTDPIPIPQTQCLCSVKTLQRDNNEPKMAKEVEVRENHPTAHLPSNSFRVTQPLRNGFQGQWFDQSKPKLNFGPHCTPRAPAPYGEPGFRQFPQPYPRDVHGYPARPLSLRPTYNYVSILGSQDRGNYSFPNNCYGRTVLSYPPYKNTVQFFQVPHGSVPPKLPIPSLMDVNPFPLRYSQGRQPPKHIPHVPDPCSLSQGAHFDRSRHQTPSQADKSHYSTKYVNNFRRPNDFPGVPGTLKEGQCPVKTLLANFTRFLQPIQSRAVAEPSANCQQTYGPSGDPTGSSESPVLDPTVPQKLTMRNCRLEAGPILEPKSDGGFKSEKDVVSEASAPVTCENSREYVCAQNGCKNAGVRICKGCLSIIYCSETCQLKHWTLKHKMECYQLKELRG